MRPSPHSVTSDQLIAAIKGHSVLTAQSLTSLIRLGCPSHDRRRLRIECPGPRTFLQPLLDQSLRHGPDFVGDPISLDLMAVHQGDRSIDLRRQDFPPASRSQNFPLYLGPLAEGIFR